MSKEEEDEDENQFKSETSMHALLTSQSAAPQAEKDADIGDSMISRKRNDSTEIGDQSYIRDVTSK